MLIVMRHDATEEEIAPGRRPPSRRWATRPAPMPGRQRTTVGLVGNDGRVDASRLAGAAGRPGSHPRHQALQAGLARVAARAHRRPAARRPDHRRRRSRRHGRPLLGRERAADPATRRTPVRDAGATVLRGRRLQAAHLALLVPGPGPKGLALLARAREETGLLIVTEAMDRRGARAPWPRSPTSSRSAPATCRTTRCSSRRAGCGKPVLLKRGLAGHHRRSCCSRPSTSWPRATRT